MRKLWIDYLRCLGVVGVLSIHVTAPFYNRYSEIDNSIWWIANILNTSGRISVPLFVMISGAVLLGQDYTTMGFYKKRFLRLFIPITFWSILYLLFRILNGAGLKVILWMAVEGMSYYHMWYLSMYLCLMAFTPFINNFTIGKPLNDKDIFILSILFLILYSMNWASSFIKYTEGVSIYWFKIFPIYICYFIMGYYISAGRFVLKINKIMIKSAIFIILLAVPYLNYLSCEKLGIVKDYFIMNNYGPLVLILTILLFLLFYKYSNIFVENRFIISLSDSSFGIYLVHPLLLYYIRKIMSIHFNNNIYTIPIMIVLLFIMSFSLMYLIRKSKIGRQIC